MSIGLKVPTGAPGVLNAALSPDVSTAGIAAFVEFQNDGDYSDSNSGTDDWLLPNGTSVAAHYEIRVDVTAGSFDMVGSAPTGSWIALSTTRAWGRETVGTCTFNVQIREAGSQIIRYTSNGNIVELL